MIDEDDVVIVSASARLGAIEIAMEMGDTRVSVLYTPFKARELCLALAELAASAERQMPTF
jgi:hypothetical protein